MTLTFSRDATTVWAAAALAAATVLAWIGVATAPHSMALAGFLTAWTLMMTAMMLPSIVPLVLLYRGSRLVLTLGYLLVWSALGVVPYALMEWTMTTEPVRAAAVLAAAGVYELTPLKRTCLRHCQSPATFLMQRFDHGAFRLGIEHGIWCTGCCVGLMAVLVFAAAMSLLWAAAIAAIVVVQKVLPIGAAPAWVTGVALIAAAAVVWFR
jgi:predicted metal-binding membrane protein